MSNAQCHTAASLAVVVFVVARPVEAFEPREVWSFDRAKARTGVGSHCLIAINWL